MAWAPIYATVEELNDYQRNPLGDDVDADAQAFALETASRAVDTAAGRQFGLVESPVQNTYTPEYDRRRGVWRVDIDDLMTTTGLAVVNEDNEPIIGYQLTPTNAAMRSRPWTAIVFDRSTSITGNVRITALWGWTEVPVPIKQATLLQANRICARRNSPFGISGSPDTGGELRLLAKIDPDVQVAIVPFARRWAAV